MNITKRTVLCMLAALILSGCSFKQVSQAVYDGLKTTECTKRTGDPYCNSSSNQSE